MTNFFNFLYNTYHRALATIVRKKHDNTNYDFNMSEFYTMDGKIQENRQRLREIFENYKKIESYYPLYIGYIALIGVYSFDIINYFFMINNIHFIFIHWIFLFVHLLMFVYSFILFFKLVYLKPLFNDLLPNDVYDIIYSQVIQNEDRMSNDNKNLSDNDYTIKIQSETNTHYLKSLEKSVSSNFKEYEKKKNILGRLIKNIYISIIVYILLISVFKIEVMNTDKHVIGNEQQKVEKQDTNKVKQEIVIPIRITNESKEDSVNKSLLTEDKKKYQK